MSSPENLLRRIFADFIQQCDINETLGEIPIAQGGRTLILAIGKGAIQLAQASEAQLLKRFQGEFPATAYALCRHGEVNPCQHFKTLFGSHPLPDQNSIDSTGVIMEEIASLGERDNLVCLLSGGGSALLCQPPASIGLQEKISICDALLRSGADITEINCVRKHISAVKGGRLARLAYPAKVFCYAISDVVGDTPEVIASGPTVADSSSQADAIDILKRYQITPAASIAQYLSDSQNETVKPGERCLERNHFSILLSPKQAFSRLQNYLAELDIDIHFLGAELTGEAHELAQNHARLAINAANNQPAKAQLYISGGEATVTVRGTGKGGPNTEYALALALALNGHPQIYALSADSDGIDGSGDNAGAIIDPQSLLGRQVDAKQYLLNSDSYGFFKRFGRLLETGPTYTNVNDFRAILILPASAAI
ncbi:MAG: glycerate kinase [Cellvibrionaceae bacterium]|nr:glycerate kinase [Cellvibrionaceae bacterium]